jgi:four helix bundle protein
MVPELNNQPGEPPPVQERVFDLEERTARFGESIIRFCKTIPLNPITQPLVNQLIRSGTSIGANYCEADDAVSKKEFCQKIGHCKKEARETKYWLRMIVTAFTDCREEAKRLWLESKELHLIFAKILRKDKKA